MPIRVGDLPIREEEEPEPEARPRSVTDLMGIQRTPVSMFPAVGETIKRGFLESLIPPEAVKSLAERLGGGVPSKLGGAIPEMVKSAIKGEPIPVQAYRAFKAKPKPLAEVAAKATEVLGPTGFDVVTVGGGRALGLGAMIGGGLARRAAQAPEKAAARQVLKELRENIDLGARGVISRMQREEFPGFDPRAEVRAVAPKAKKPKIPQLVTELPEKRARVMPWEGRTTLTQGIGRVDDVLREMATSPNLRNEERRAIETIRRSQRAVVRSSDQIIGEAQTEVSPMAHFLSNLPKGKDRNEVARRIALYIQNSDFRAMGSLHPTIDRYAEQVRGTLSRLRTKAVGAGIETGFIADFFPNYNPRYAEAMDLYRKNRIQDAVIKVKALYARTGEKVPKTNEVIAQLAGAVDEAASQTKPGLRSFSPHLELPRELDIPGSMGDGRDPFFDADEFVRAIDTYIHETGLRIADAKFNGPDGELFASLANKVSDPGTQDLIHKFRQRIIRPYSLDELERRENALFGTMRNIQILSKMGRGVVQNSMQTSITTLPRTTATAGIRKALGNYVEGMAKTFGPDAAQARIVAQRAGAVRDRIVHEMENLSEGRPLSGAASRFLDVNLFSPTEVANNVSTFHIGREYGRDLAEMIWKGDREAAEKEIRLILDADPNLANNIIGEAEIVGPNISDASLDEIGYQLAVKLQFRNGAVQLPLAWLTPTGKWLTQFRGFGYNYSRFLADDIVKPLLTRGEWRPLATLGFSALASGHLTRMARRALRLARVTEDGVFDVEETPYEEKTAKQVAKSDIGKRLGLDDPDSPAWEAIHDYSTAVTLGIFGELAASIEKGPEGAVTELAPASATALSRAGAAVVGKAGPGGLLATGLEEFTPSYLGSAQAASRAIKEEGGYRRPFLSPLIKGEKKFQKRPLSFGAAGRMTGRVLSRQLHDLPIPSFNSATPARTGVRVGDLPER